jgi:hypothetical protein
MERVFEHADGRIMVDVGPAGGIGGGCPHVFHRLATDDEAAAYRASLAPAAVEPEPEPAAETPPTEALDQPQDG